MKYYCENCGVIVLYMVQMVVRMDLIDQLMKKSAAILWRMKNERNKNNFDSRRILANKL